MPAEFRFDQATPGPGNPGQSRHDLVPGEEITLVVTDPAPGPGVTYLWEIIDKRGSTAALTSTTASTTTIGPAGAITQPCSFLIELTVTEEGSAPVKVRRICSVRTANAALRVPVFPESAPESATYDLNDPDLSTDNAVYANRSGLGLTQQNAFGWAEWAWELVLAVESGSSGSGGPPSGAAGGDLAATYPNPTVARIQGRDVASTAPGDGDTFTWDAGTSTWRPTALAGLPPSGAASGDLSGTYPGPVVAQIQGEPVQSGAPTENDVLRYDLDTGTWLRAPHGSFADDVDLNGNNIIDVGLVDGRDVSADGATLDALAAAGPPTLQETVDAQGGVAVDVAAANAVRFDNTTDTTPILTLGGQSGLFTEARRFECRSEFNTVDFYVDEGGDFGSVGSGTMTKVVLTTDGPEGDMPFRFDSEDTGFWLNTPGQLVFEIAGSQELWLNATHLRPAANGGLALGDTTRRFLEGWLQSLLVNDGVAAIPSIRFASETNTGFYRSGAGVLRTQILGVTVLQTEASGVTVTGNLNAFSGANQLLSVGPLDITIEGGPADGGPAGDIYILGGNRPDGEGSAAGQVIIHGGAGENITGGGTSGSNVEIRGGDATDTSVAGAVASAGSVNIDGGQATSTNGDAFSGAVNIGLNVPSVINSAGTWTHTGRLNSRPEIATEPTTARTTADDDNGLSVYYDNVADITVTVDAGTPGTYSKHTQANTGQVLLVAGTATLHYDSATFLPNTRATTSFVVLEWRTATDVYVSGDMETL